MHDVMADDARQSILSANNALGELTVLSQRFGASISSSFAKGIAGGKSFEDVLRNLGMRLSEIALKAALKPLDLVVGQAFDSLSKGLAGSFLSSLSGVTANANGSVMARGLVQPFAEGGVIASPTYFPLARGVGLMGERGAEAIMPLTRGADGKLGVRAAGGGRPVNVTVNIATTDAESFRRSQAQVSAALARAVARGQRAL